MKKKLTKEQLLERKRKLNKAFHILAYVSLAFNVLFISLMAFSGCAVKGPTQSDDPLAAQTQKRNEKRGAFDLSKPMGYKFTDLPTPQTYTTEFIDDFYVAMGGDYQILVRASDDVYVSVDSDIHVNIQLHSPVQPGDYLKINWGFDSYENYYDIDNLYRWVNSGDNNIKEVYLQTYSYNADQSDLNKLHFALNTFLNKVEYEDIDLSKWNPYQFYSGQWNRYTDQLYQHIDIAVGDCLFAVNGNFYTRIIIRWSGLLQPFVVIDKDTEPGDIIMNHADNTSNDIQSSARWEIIEDVTLVNEFTSETLEIMANNELNPYRVSGLGWVGDGYYRAIYYETLHFLNDKFTDVRLFNRNIGGRSALGNFSNYDVLTANDWRGYANVNTGDFGDVFGMISTAFGGLHSLFQFTILPGITLGTLIFVPLIGIIIFAVVKLLRQ